MYLAECQLTSVCVTGRKIVMRPTWRRREFWIRLTYLSPLEVLWRSWSSINMPVPNFHLLFVQSTNISLSSSKSTGIHGEWQVPGPMPFPCIVDCKCTRDAEKFKRAIKSDLSETNIWTFGHIFRSELSRELLGTPLHICWTTSYCQLYQVLTPRVPLVSCNPVVLVARSGHRSINRFPHQAFLVRKDCNG